MTTATHEATRALIAKLKAEADMQNKCGISKVRDLLLEAAEALLVGEIHASQPTTGNWEPIETAPKDGTTILLSDGARVSYGGWIDAAAQGVDECEAHLISCYWWSVDLITPTLWQPLPAPPDGQ